ncbi:MAG: PAS domain-containing sensor histidine kinase [Methanophagales archaeon]|nr:PAS domain-containing sensor histidine kinase [Methanophagales archaeon]
MDERRKDSYFFMRLERDKCFIVSFATLACVILSLSVGLAMGKETVYTHFLYIPILLAAVWYYKKAIYVALFLSAIHILVTYAASGFTIGPYIRAATFMLMAYVIGQISELRAKGKKELEKEERFSGNIITTIPDSLLVLDSDLRIKSANRTFYDTFQMKPEKVIGGSIGEILKDKEGKLNSELKKLFGTALTLNNFELPYQIQGQGGRIFNVRARGIFISPEEGVGELVVIQDITERKKAEEGIRRLNEELEQKIAERTKELEARNTELEQFAYTVSHDLRSPLITVRGFVEMLRDDLERKGKKEVERDLKYIETAAAKMNRLLNDTLQLSRIGRFVNPPEDVSFGELVRDALRLIAGELESSGVEVSVSEDFPSVHVDRMRIVELLVNLIGNSIKYRGEQPRPKIEIGNRRNDGETAFFVKDNGVGIAQSQRDKVFGLFYQVNKDNKGTGAGLAIVKKIVEVHGGRIWIESEEGKGCTVCFTLPVVKEEKGNE